MNSGNASPLKNQEQPEELDYSSLSTTADARDEAIATLQTQLAAEKDARREERFLWFVGVLILLNILFLSEISNHLLTVPVLVLELIFLVLVARRLGVEEVQAIINRAIGLLAKSR